MWERGRKGWLDWLCFYREREKKKMTEGWMDGGSGVERGETKIALMTKLIVVKKKVKKELGRKIKSS